MRLDYPSTALPAPATAVSPATDLEAAPRDTRRQPRPAGGPGSPGSTNKEATVVVTSQNEDLKLTESCTYLGSFGS